ncbi:hypothetical protein BHM03_00007512 [Ensete ventricosum]|nr:hypothetical protein BHM03_00007512 [Ensete ventricosum]
MRAAFSCWYESCLILLRILIRGVYKRGNGKLRFGKEGLQVDYGNSGKSSGSSRGFGNQVRCWCSGNSLFLVEFLMAFFHYFFLLDRCFVCSLSYCSLSYNIKICTFLLPAITPRSEFLLVLLFRSLRSFLANRVMSDCEFHASSAQQDHYNQSMSNSSLRYSQKSGQKSVAGERKSKVCLPLV